VACVGWSILGASGLLGSFWLVVLCLACLLMGRSRGGRVVHVVCAAKKDYLAVVTVYAPCLLEWEPDFKTRRKR